MLPVNFLGSGHIEDRLFPSFLAESIDQLFESLEETTDENVCAFVPNKSVGFDEFSHKNPLITKKGKIKDKDRPLFFACSAVENTKYLLVENKSQEMFFRSSANIDISIIQPSSKCLPVPPAKLKLKRPLSTNSNKSNLVSKFRESQKFMKRMTIKMSQIDSPQLLKAFGPTSTIELGNL